MSLLATAAWAAGAVGAAFAQAPAAEESEAVVVTGTLIRGIAPVGAPVVSLSAEKIEETGLLDTASVLKTVPAISYLGISESTTGTTANGNGTNTTFGTGVNIHGLGQQATLTLINGHRGAPGGQFGNYFEPSNVPTIALGGVEVLTDGASAIYGSDAMAGVVNLILRRGFEGFEFRGSYGLADEYEATDFSAVVGSTWDTGHFMLAGQRYYHSNVIAADRSDLFISDGPSVFPGSGALPRGYTNFSPNANIRTGTGAGTTYYACAPGATTAAQCPQNQQNIVGQWWNSTALPKTTREAFVLDFDQEVGEGIKLYGMGFHSLRRWEGFGHVSGATTGVNSTLTVTNANPNFITGIPGVTTSETVLVSQLANLGPLLFIGRETSWLGVVGATFELPGDWQLDVNAQRSANRVARIRYNNLQTCGMTGGATCLIPTGEITGGALAQTNRAFAFNPFGSQNAYVERRIRASDLQQGFYDSDIFTAKFDGPLFELPGGAVRAAVGFEYREDTEGQRNTTESTAALYGQYVIIATDKSMNVKSAFAEVVFPLAANAPFAHRLDLSIAGRYSDYDILDEATTNPKIGITWDPIADLSLSASYSTSFRVNLASTDPNNAPLLRIRAISDYRGTGGSANAIQRGGGNPDLTPEESETYTIGANWRPSALDGFELSASYFDVTYEGIIDTPGAAVLNAITAGSEAIYGAFIQRRPSTLTPGADDTAWNALVASLIANPLFTGAVVNPVNVIVDARSQNAGVVETSGIDLRVAQSWDTEIGEIDASLAGSYFIGYKRSLTPTGVLVSRVGQIDFPQRYRLRGEVGWRNDNLSARLFANYTPEYSNTYVTPAANVESYLTFDLGLAYETGDKMSSELLHDIRFGVNVQNLFDESPPYVAEFDQNFDSSITSMLGRVVTFQLSKAF
ncbi:MAG: TonB-dependent receptor [Hyphomonadaceae bacterium]|nr:TonB-dependent receptor [Hyphomonadaceae bacterium]